MLNNLWQNIILVTVGLYLFFGKPGYNTNSSSRNDSFHNNQNIVLLSDFQSELGCPGDFDSTCVLTQFTVENNIGKLSLHIPKGKWNLKVYHDHKIFGQNGIKGAPGIFLKMAENGDLIFLYHLNTHRLSIQSSSLESRSLPPAPILLSLDDTLIYDPNGNMIANPGDSIQYTMILKNQSGQSMLNAIITHSGDPNVTFDSTSIKASPLAFNDTFTYDMHPKSVMAAFGVLANDFDLNDPLPNPPFNTNLNVVRVNGITPGSAITTVGGGTVTMMADGSFSYDSTGVNGAITDVFTYAVLDLDGFEDSAQVLIQFNMAPVISSGLATTDSICAFEQRDTFLMTAAFTITDDGTMISSATIEICNNYLPTEDTLIPGSLPMGINAIWTDGSGTLMLAGIASLADYETAIENIQYLNSSENPNTATRTICITVNDGTLNSNEVIRFLKVKQINDCPIAVRDTVAILENQNISMFNVLANDLDVDMDLLSVTKVNGGITLSGVVINGGTITNLSSAGVLNFMHTTGFSGLDSLSEGEIFYTRFEYTASDGLCEEADSVIIKITGVNDAPLIASNLMATDSICAFEQRDTFLFTTAFTLLDDEDNTDSATIQICNNYLSTEDTLIAGILPGGIMTQWNDVTGTLKLYGSTAKGNYEAAIEAIQYLNSNNIPNTNGRRICITVHDSALISNQVTRELKVKPVNDCPVAVRDTVSILENQSITLFNVLDNDMDIELDPLSVTKINGSMTLSAVNINGGTINNLSSAGVLNFSHTTGLTGLDSLSEGEIFYTRFEYTASDGACEDADSVIIKITGVNDAPLIASNLMATDSICAFEQRDTFLFTTAFTLLDDEDNTDSATIQICNNYLSTEDTLIAGILPGGIMTQWNDVTGTLKLYGSTAKANYESAIEAIQYLNSSDIPNTNGRRICITVHDSALFSNQVTRELKVKPVNDCPVAVRDTLSITENGSSAAGFVLTNDSDLENDMLTVTMVNASGINTNVNVSGGTISSTSAGAITFIHTSGANGLDTLNGGDMFFARARYTITDGLCTDTDSVIIKITGINDAPVADSNAYTVVQTTTLSVAAPGILSDDVDIDHLSSITVGSVNGSPANVGTMIVLASGADLTVQSNGSFVYNPKCVVGGLDSFSYQAKDEHNLASNTAKVYIIVSQTLWFVDGAVVTTGNGSFSAPFKTLVEAQIASSAGQSIFVFPGTYAESITLKNNQKLIGADENWNCPSGPTIRNASSNSTINGTLTLAQNDTIRGIEFGNGTASVPMIVDNGATAGNLFISNTNLNTSTSSGLRIANGGALNVTIDNFNSSSRAEAIFINNSSGNLAVSGGTITPANGTADTMVTIKAGSINATINTSISQLDTFPLIFIGAGHTGNITFQTGTLSATNGSGLQFDNADGSYNFNGTTSLNATINNGKAAVDILNGSAGTFSFSSNTTISSPADTAFDLRGSTASVTYSGNITQANNQAMVYIFGHTSGTVTFQTGTLSATQGSGLQFDNADGTYNFNGTNTMNGGDAGIDILNGSSGTFVFSTNSSITRANNVSGAAFNLSSSDANVTYNGSMTLGTGTGNMVAINNHDAGNISFNTGNLTKGGTSTQGISIQNSNGGTINFNNPTIMITTTSAHAVSLTNNSGGTMNFTPVAGGNGMDLVTTSGNGFNATSGGTVNVTGSGNTISSTTGTALNINATTIGASNLTFQSISSNGGSNGISLNSTGTGGLFVTGTGTTDGSGGTIQNISARGAEFISANNITLKNINFTNANTTDGGTCTDLSTGGCNAVIYLSSVGTTSIDNINITGTTTQQGINGISVSNFTLSNSTITNCGTPASVEEGCIKLRELTGTCAITNCDLAFPGQDVVELVNTTGPGLLLNVDSTTFRDNQSSGTGGNGLQVRSQGTASIIMNVNSCSFLRLRTNGIHATAINSASNDVDVTTSTFDPGTGTMIGLDLDADNSGVLKFNVESNPVIYSRNGPAINVFGDNNAIIDGRINNNPDVQVKSNVGSNVGSGIRANLNKDASGRIEVKSNVVNVGSDDAGIDLTGIGKTTSNPGGATKTLDATVTGNSITIGATSTYGIVIISASNALDNNAICVNVASNVITRNVSSIASFRARVPSATGFFRMNGFVTNAEATWNANSNTPTSAGGSEVSFGGSGTFGSCTATLPTNGGLTPNN